MSLNIKDFKPGVLTASLDYLSSNDMMERGGGRPCGGKRFFDYHPEATIDDFCKRFECTYEQAVERIKSFGLGYQREREIIGYGSSQIEKRDFEEKSLVINNANGYTDSNKTNTQYNTGIGFILYLLRDIGSYRLMKSLYYSPSKKISKKKVTNLIEFLYQLYQSDIEEYLTSGESIEEESKKEIFEKSERKKFLKLLIKLKKLIDRTKFKNDTVKIDELTESEISQLSIVLDDFWLSIRSSVDIDKEFMNFIKCLPVSEQINISKS